MKLVATDKRNPGFLLNAAAAVSVFLNHLPVFETRNKVLTKAPEVSTSVPKKCSCTLVYIHYSPWNGDANGCTTLSMLAPPARYPSRRSLLVSHPEQQHERLSHLHHGLPSLEQTDLVDTDGYAQYLLRFSTSLSIRNGALY